MAEVGGLCERCLCCQGCWNGEWNDRKASRPWPSGEGQRRGSGFIAEECENITSNADHCCLLQLPDDVKQNIEDAGARYIPYVTRLCRIRQLLDKHADLNVGEMVLPTTMTQDDQIQDQKAVGLGALCKALWYG